MRRSSRSSSGSDWSSQYLKTIDSTEVCVLFRSSTFASRIGPKEWTVARTWAPSSPLNESSSTGWPWPSNVHPSDAQRSGTCGASAEPGCETPVRSPFTSATNTGTPRSDSWPAISWRVFVLPVPVAPATSPWRFTIDSGSRIRVAVSTSSPSIAPPKTTAGSSNA